MTVEEELKALRRKARGLAICVLVLDVFIVLLSGRVLGWW